MASYPICPICQTREATVDRGQKCYECRDAMMRRQGAILPPGHKSRHTSTYTLAGRPSQRPPVREKSH